MRVKTRFALVAAATLTLSSAAQKALTISANRRARLSSEPPHSSVLRLVSGERNWLNR